MVGVHAGRVWSSEMVQKADETTPRQMAPAHPHLSSLTRNSDLAPVPEARARCGSAARPESVRGRWTTCAPTATHNPASATVRVSKEGRPGGGRSAGRLGTIALPSASVDDITVSGHYASKGMSFEPLGSTQNERGSGAPTTSKTSPFRRFR
jgi:hypothetical protein